MRSSGPPIAFLQASRKSKADGYGEARCNYVSAYEVKGEKHFPSFFLDSRYGRVKLEAVSKALGDFPGATKLHFLNRRSFLAGVTLLEAVAGGALSEPVSSSAANNAMLSR